MSNAADPTTLHLPTSAQRRAAHRAAPYASHHAFSPDNRDAPAAAKPRMMTGYVLGPTVPTSLGVTITQRRAGPITISP
jgi:hypothetical protein